MHRFVHSLGRAVGALAAMLLVVLVAIASVETVAWVLFEKSWAEASEIRGILLIWFGLLGAAWGVEQRIHLAVEALGRWLSPPWRARFGRVASAATAVFGALLATYGARLAATVTNTLPATGLPASVQYFPAAVCGALLVVFALAELFSGASGRGESAEDGER